MNKSDVLICGAGIAGVAAAYHLSCRHGIRDIILVDERPPLSLTSDKSSEGYRNWWPGPDTAMVQFMNRSIDLLEELAASSGNRFQLNRRGYVYVTADPARARRMALEAQEISRLGAGPLRSGSAPYQPSPAHGYTAQPSGADFLDDPAGIQIAYPFLADDVLALVHARRCGWLSAQQLGMFLLEQARAAGTQLVQGRVTAVTTRHNRVTSVQVQSGGKTHEIATAVFVNAAGPLINQVAQLLDLDLPVTNEAHSKLAFEDTQDIIPRNAPLMIWNDPIHLPWSAAEHAEIEATAEMRRLLDEFPAGLHFRPEGGPGSKTILALWPYHIEATAVPSWPIDPGSDFVDIIMRGLSRMIPGLTVYLERMPRPYIDSGYYCKTRENRPLIGPLSISGAFLIGALSGYGIMAAPAAGELLAAHITGAELPAYAPAFALERYADPSYRALLANWDAMTGQL
jgi:glycine/D-amino acid oxidase-like deaminating enzyme